MLSQEEINALLAGASGSGDSSTTDSSADNNAQNAAGQEDNNNTPSAQNEQQFVLSDSERMRLVKYPISVWEQRQRHLVLYLIRK